MTLSSSRAKLELQSEDKTDEEHSKQDCQMLKFAVSMGHTSELTLRAFGPNPLPQPVPLSELSERTF
ncbi:hypothetical protein Q5P01_001540 [Channa striata]|uniref:Uncharacterized protein n=1 Tax=Channa striata TaxID=64152 RepID=A0AA88T417_CHASR|nr:hypothetical protein Q5P01_001540 [Channa striata]